jgi:ATP-dependent RNA helicase MSS116
VGEEEEQTHASVKQEIVVASLEDQVAAVTAILARESAKPGYKIMVFFTTARQTGFMASMTARCLRKPIKEIHSRMSQLARTRTSDVFRQAKEGILFSSDVSARGMDYPDVTFVLQVGITEREQYIHRLGRTARAGSSVEGGGMLLVAPFELRYMKQALSDMKLVETPLNSLLSSPIQQEVQAVLHSHHSPEQELLAKQCYGAWLGFYNGNLRKCGWDKRELINQANFYSSTIGLSEVPSLEAKTVGKMGLKGFPGLRIEGRDGVPRREQTAGGGHGGGGRGGGGGGGRGRF